MDKTRKIGICVAILFMAIGGSTAMAVIIQDSTTWEHAYEADAKPVTAGIGTFGAWDDSTNSTLVPDGGNNYLNVTVPGYDGWKYTETGTLDTTTNGGIAYEFRIKVTANTVLARIYSSSNASRYLAMYVSGSNITIRDGDVAPSGVGNTNGIGEWTTFRITCDDVKWRVYRQEDQSLQAELPVLADYGSKTNFRFDMRGAGNGASFDFDYMRFTDGVPEPATMGLLALGGLMLRRRRR